MVMTCNMVFFFLNTDKMFCVQSFKRKGEKERKVLTLEILKCAFNVLDIRLSHNQ